MTERKERTTAKRKFTLERKGLLRAIEQEVPSEILTDSFTKLTRLWNHVQDTHEAYLRSLDVESDAEEEDTWIEALQVEFRNAEIKLHETVTQKRLADFDNTRKMREEENKTSEIEKLLTERSIMELEFNNMETLLKEILRSTEPGKGTSLVENAFKDMKASYEQVNKAHHVYTVSLGGHPDQLNWVKGIQEAYRNCCLLYNKFLNTAEKEVTPSNQNVFKLEKIKLPTFKGDLKDYSIFKSDFTKYVLPQIEKDKAGFVLKSCLDAEPLNSVKNIEDSIDLLWKRLDEKYGQPAMLTELVMNEFKRYKSLSDTDDKGLIEFIEIIENNYKHLKLINMEREISNLSVVSLIEEKLPNVIRRKWAEEISKDDSDVDKRNPFPYLLKFLIQQRRTIEYVSADLRTKCSIKPDITDTNKQHGCWIHNSSGHNIALCKGYLIKTNAERVALIKEKGACWSCLAVGHRSSDCPNKSKCSKEGCQRQHHETLHEAHVEGIILQTMAHTNKPDSTDTMFQIMSIPYSNTSTDVNVLWDGGSNCSLITFSKAKYLGLKGTPVSLNIQKVGEDRGESQVIESFIYNISLRDINNRTKTFRVYGVERISSKINHVNYERLKHMFAGNDLSTMIIPVGDIDILIGIEYAVLHPQMVQTHQRLVLSENCFGKCISGAHPDVKANSEPLITNVAVNHVIGETIENFINAESLGNTYNLLKKNNVNSQDISIKERRELELIENGLEFKGDHWEASYPWEKSPNYLPDNRQTAIAILKSTEKRLMKNKESVYMYNQQIEDMLDRKVARKLSNEEIRGYDGPVYYIPHHEILKPDSESTPYRIVFNSSSNYKGHVLNNYWAKGPTLINNLTGVLFRFRENYIGAVGDIQKMYHSIKIPTQDQHTHRFLWRNCQLSKEPNTYVMTSVCFGDKPAGTIAISALNKTVDMGGAEFTRAKETVTRNTYVDDIIDSFSNQDECTFVTEQINSLISVGGFRIKKWTISKHTEGSNSSIFNISSLGIVPSSHEAEGQTDSAMEKGLSSEINSQKVLGVYWVPLTDHLCYTVKLNFSAKKRGVRLEPDLTLLDIKQSIPVALTKRIILSCVNGLYDPLGLLAPFIIRAKILLRALWLQHSKTLEWDDAIPNDMQNQWHNFFIDMFEVNRIHFKRCVKPVDATNEDPILTIFCDGSQVAFGACAYVCWKLKDNRFETNLLMAKTHIAPVKTLSIVKIEVNAARLGARVKAFIDTESRIAFSKTYMITDSEITLAMIQKDSYKLNTYFGVRIAEIQERTEPNDWYWTSSENNIADWLSRGKTPVELHGDSQWQRGPNFMNQPESEWPVKKAQTHTQIPEITKNVMRIEVENVELRKVDSLSNRIAIKRFSSYMKLIRVTCRILSCYQYSPKLSFTNILNQPTSLQYKRAIEFWIRDAQASITNFEKRFANLGPIKCTDSGIYMVGKRIEKWMEYSYNDIGLPLIPYEHRLSSLYAGFVHNLGHHGVMTTVAKIRLRFWITKANRLVKGIVRDCVTCRKNAKELQQQVMGQLPMERVKPSPPFYNVAVDYFGPFTIKGEVNQRTKGKGYGVIFTCLYTRAVYVDLVNNASTDSFLIVLRKFVSIRGYPAKFYSDNGTQLRCASKELASMIRNIDWQKICEFGAEAGVQWKFSPADAPWQNGCVESLIKPIKKAIKLAIGPHVLKFSELQAVMYEAANLVNERPMGKHPTNPEEGSYLCPNDILLGRATSRVPGGPFKEVSGRRRFEFVQKLADTFWRKWTRNYFSSLIIRKKWHTEKRNVCTNDIVIVKDANAVRGNWRIGKITKTYPSGDGFVRRCQVSYKQTRPGLSIPKKFSTIDRPVQDLVVIVSAEDA